MRLSGQATLGKAKAMVGHGRYASVSVARPNQDCLPGTKAGPGQSLNLCILAVLILVESLMQTRNAKIRDLRKRGKTKLVRVNDQLNSLTWEIFERNVIERCQYHASGCCS